MPDLRVSEVTLAVPIRGDRKRQESANHSSIFPWDSNKPRAMKVIKQMATFYSSRSATIFSLAYGEFKFLSHLLKYHNNTTYTSSSNSK